MNLVYVDVRRWRDALQDATELPITSRGLLFVLAKWMNADGGSCYPGRQRIAAYCGLSEPTVDRHLAAAVAAGYLYVVRPGRRGQFTRYAAVVPADRLDERGRIVPRNVELAHHLRCANDELAHQTGRDSASNGPRQRITSDRRTSVSTTSVSTTSSDSYESGRTFADAHVSGRDDKDHHLGDELEDHGDDKDHHLGDELLDHLGALFGSLSVGEESTARGMIASGAHPKAVVAKIAAGRCSAGIMDRSARGGQA